VSILDELLPVADDEATAWPAGLPDHLSASQANQFLRCAEQYRQRAVLGRKERPAGALVWGSADHYAHEQNFAQKIRSGEDIGEGDVKLAFAEGFDQAVERNGGESEVDWGDDKPGEMKDRGATLVGVYHQQVSPRIQPTAVETKFSVELPGVPVPVIGYVDLTTEQTVIERKTAGRAEKKVKPDWRVQGSLYQAVTELPVEWHVSVKSKTPAVYTPLEAPDLALARNLAAVGATKALMRTVALGILSYWNTYGPDEPWPGAVTHPWACDFCGYRPECAWWAGERSEPKPDPFSFGDPSSGRAPDQSVLERECELLTRSLLTIAEASGKNVEAIAKVVAGNRDSHAGELGTHKAWLEKQLTRAEKAT